MQNYHEYTLSRVFPVLSFPVYSVHGQSDRRSETIRSSFEMQESHTGFKLGRKIGDTQYVCSNDAIICDCMNWRFRASFVSYPYAYIALKWFLFCHICCTCTVWWWYIYIYIYMSHHHTVQVTKLTNVSVHVHIST